MFPEGGQTRKHCFLAMFPKGGQTRKHCFLAMFPEGGQTRKHCFLAMFPEGGQTRKHCFLGMFPEGGQTRKHCFLAMFPEGGQTWKHGFYGQDTIAYRLSTVTLLPQVSWFRQYRYHRDIGPPLISNYPWELVLPYARPQPYWSAVSRIIFQRLYYGLITENKYKL
jgi:hypothetical protein